jgi:hypothetical protein
MWGGYFYPRLLISISTLGKQRTVCGSGWRLLMGRLHVLTLANERYGNFSPTIRPNPIDGLQASLLLKLEKLDWGSILDNKSDGHPRRG